MSLTSAEIEAIDRAGDYNHNQYNAATNPYGMGGIGYKTPGAAGLEGNWSQSIRDNATIAEGVSRLAGEAAVDAADAASSAAEAATYLRSTTSTSTVTIGTGAKTFVVADDRQFTTQDFVLCVNQADEDEWVFGQVTSWTPATNTLILNVDSGDTSGSGTFSAWNVFITGPRGPQGATGAGTPAPQANKYGVLVVQNDADDNYEQLSQGTTGQALASAGADALPVWTTPLYVDSAQIGGAITDGDYVIGMINKTVTLTEASILAGAGTGTVALYLSPDRTSASGTAITGGSFSASTAVDTNTLTGNNTVAAATPRYLVAAVSSASSLENVAVEMTYSKAIGH